MSDYQIIVMVCLLGIVGEAIRIIRPGQVLFTSGLTGRYRSTASVQGASSAALAFHLAPILASGPTFRLKNRPDHADPLDVTGFDEVVAEVFRSSRWVQAGSQVLLVHLVTVVPLVLLAGVVPHGWLVLGVSLAVIQVYLQVTFFLAHRKLHPGEIGDRIQHLFTMFFFPPAGVFAADHLANRTLDRFHPLVGALVLCPEKEARRVADIYMRVWGNPISSEKKEESAAHLEKARFLVVEKGWNPADFAGPPQSEGLESRAYCPRCHAQYLVVGGSCPDCPGIAKFPFEDPPPHVAPGSQGP